MKSIIRVLVAGAGIAAAGLLAVASPAAAATPTAATPVSASAAQSDFCTASVSGTTVTGNCTLSTILGSFGATFTGTVQANGNASGQIVLRAGFLGTRHGTWTGGPFLPGQTATVNYTVGTPLGPVNGSFQVPIPG
jgi:hypothetical protein